LHRQLRHYALDMEISLNDPIVRTVEHRWAGVPERTTCERLIDPSARERSS